MRWPWVMGPWVVVERVVQEMRLGGEGLKELVWDGIELGMWMDVEDERELDSGVAECTPGRVVQCTLALAGWLAWRPSYGG